MNIHPIFAGTSSNRSGIKERSDRLMNFFLPGYFLIGLGFAFFYNTWDIAIGLGGTLLVLYYAAKIAFPNSCLYQYVLSIVLGVFMAQFIYQMHGMFEMHFFTFIGSALLITYQKWKLQVPMLLFVLLHHSILDHLKDLGFSNVYFSFSEHSDLPAFLIHILLMLTISFICGWGAFQLHKYHMIQLQQTAKLTLLQEEARGLLEKQKNEEALQQRNTILESIGDAFFAVDSNWIVTYWNQMAEKLLHKSKEEMLDHLLWDVFSDSVGSISYQKYHEARANNQPIHFEDYFEPLKKWYEISAYPSDDGISVYFKDITLRKKIMADLEESEQRYSDVFHFSPLPMWVVDLESSKFIDVNLATIEHYGYSREEFLTMNLKDIRPPSELSSLKRGLAQGKTDPQAIAHRIMIHQKKNGELMNVEVQLAPFLFKGLKTNIVIAKDITERLKYMKAMEQQNEKLIAISWMQSHLVRAPLARIMGLIPLIKNAETKWAEKQEFLNYLTDSAVELDEVIQNITDETGIVAIK